jgi:tetratricopeptide (TPR) repeat protein
MGPATGDPTALAMAWHARAFVHSRLGEQRQAISCYRHALALVGEREHPMARGVLVIVLAEFGDACQAAGDLPAAVQAWRQAVQVLDELGWPDLLGVGAKLEEAELSSPPG